MKRSAFTLLELTAVLLIAAVAAAAVALRIQGPMRNAQMRDVVGQLGQFDSLTRRACREQDRPLRMALDLAGGTLKRLDARGQSADGMTLRLPTGFRIERVLMRAQNTGNGTATVPCSRRGLTPTYAILLTGPGRRQWLGFVALTGQMVQLADEQEAQNIVQADAGHDAG